jgi:hypothetical protein
MPRAAILVREISMLTCWLIAPPMATLRRRDQNQFAAQLLGISHQFRITEFIAGNGEEEAEHVAEIVIHKGRDDAGRN